MEVVVEELFDELLGVKSIELRWAPRGHAPRVNTNLPPATEVSRSSLRNEGIPQGWDNTFLFFKKEGWSAPVEAQGQHGILTCGDNTASITRLWGDRTGAQRFHGGPQVSECTVSECKQHQIDLDKVLGGNEDLTPREKKGIASIMVGNKLAVVWSAGDRGGLRMRVGPITQLATAPETILFDDHVRDGAVKVESSLVDFQLLPFGKHAVLLLATTSGVYAFLLDAEGKLAPLPTRLG